MVSVGVHGQIVLVLEISKLWFTQIFDQLSVPKFRVNKRIQYLAVLENVCAQASFAGERAFPTSEWSGVCEDTARHRPGATSECGNC
jgi:hypothetical protein